MVNLGQDPTEAELSSMMGAADKDGSGAIDFEEFCLMYGKVCVEAKEEEKSELYDCFCVFDSDGSVSVCYSGLAPLNTRPLRLLLAQTDRSVARVARCCRVISSGMSSPRSCAGWARRASVRPIRLWSTS